MLNILFKRRIKVILYIHPITRYVNWTLKFDIFVASQRQLISWNRIHRINGLAGKVERMRKQERATKYCSLQQQCAIICITKYPTEFNDINIYVYALHPVELYVCLYFHFVRRASTLFQLGYALDFYETYSFRKFFLLLVVFFSFFRSASIFNFSALSLILLSYLFWWRGKINIIFISPILRRASMRIFERQLDFWLSLFLLAGWLSHSTVFRYAVGQRDIHRCDAFIRHVWRFKWKFQPQLLSVQNNCVIKLKKYTKQIIAIVDSESEACFFRRILFRAKT